jgi:hypothetical protein
VSCFCLGNLRPQSFYLHLLNSWNYRCATRPDLFLRLGLTNFCPLLASNPDPNIATSQVAGITGIYPASNFFHLNSNSKYFANHSAFIKTIHFYNYKAKEAIGNMLANGHVCSDTSSSWCVTGPRIASMWMSACTVVMGHAFVH